jgi:hypothetical protein
MGSFQAGVGRVDITPPLSAPHASWGAQVHVFAEDVDLPLTCTALVVDDGTTRAAWIDFDLIILSTPETQKIQARVGEEIGIPPELVRVSVTHNHAGPPPSSWDWAKAGVEAMKAYYALLPDYAAGAARLAVEKLQPARVGVGKGESHVAVNRRETAPDGRTVTGTNPEGPIDPEVFVMRIDALDGSPIVAAIGYTMHPTTLGPSNKKLSADWPGYLKRTVEQVTGAPTMFAQGATGDIGPGPDGYTDDIKVIQRLGSSVGAAAVIAYNEIQLPKRIYKHEKVWESGASLGKWTYDAEEGPAPVVRGSTTTVNLPLIELMPFDMAQERLTQAQEALDSLKAEGADQKEIEAATFVVKRANMAFRHVQAFSGKSETPVEINILQIGPAVFIGTEGEPFQDIGKEIKKRSPFPFTWFGGYVGGWAGYIPMPADYPAKGYEVDTSPFTPEAAAILTEAAVKLLVELAESEG